MEKVLAGLVIVLLLASLFFAGYAVAIMADLVAYVKMHCFGSMMLSAICFICAYGVWESENE